MIHVENPNNIAKENTAVLKDEVNENIQEELSEDMEVMGPGQILSDARKKAGLTQQEVAEKLNFRETLVKEIENEVFDTRLPETFNRGYLRNYAKLVNVSQDDVMASYEQLNVAKTQASELQSFSKGTEKLAESNRIMWVSYVILAILIGSTIVWWMQNNAEQAQIVTDITEVETVKTDSEQVQGSAELIEKPATTDPILEIDNANTENNTATSSEPSALINQQALKVDISSTQIDEVQTNEQNVAEPQNGSILQTSEAEVTLTSVSFTFSGDCWVNISDATGERIAWGVKKLGYVMTISGQAPFNVTLGRPELVAIKFANENIDMSQFNAGNIAKFTLPVVN